MKFIHMLCLASVTAIAGFAQAPSITAVENAATNIPPGAPNAAIAQGALFVIKGKNLGPANVEIATTFPLKTTLGGTSVQVTVGGTTVDAIMYYSLNIQVAAILPSKTPTGTGTVKVTYNGQSVTASITVVSNNIGIFTVSQSGTGDAIAFLADNGLVGPSHSANPGDIVIFWGTGLGPVDFDESNAAVQSDMTSVAIKVFIGGKSAEILFRGRNGCCTAVDTVYVRVPQGVSGCAVSVIMQIGNVVSNSTTISVADAGRTCTPINQDPTTTFGTGTHTFGGFSLERVVELIDAGTTTQTIKEDIVGGSFERVTYSSTPPQGSQIDITAYNSCTVSTQASGQSAPPPPNQNTVQYLDAGPSIDLDAPFGKRSIPKGTPGAGIIDYLATLDQTATTFTAGTYTFTGHGGPDVGPFTATYTNPPIFVWTNQTDITKIDRAAGVTLTWTGGDPAGYVAIGGSSIAYSSDGRTSTAVSFICTARVSDGSFFVPPQVLLALPPTAPIPNTTIILKGSLSLDSVSAGQTIQPPPGIEAAGIASTYLYLGSVTYQ